MSWLAGHHWGWLLLAALLGSGITLFLTLRKATVQREVLRTEVATPEVDVPAAAPEVDVPAVAAVMATPEPPAYEAPAPAVPTPSADGSLGTSSVTYDDPDATILRRSVSAPEADWADGTTETGADTVLDAADLEDTDGNASASGAALAGTGAVAAGAHAAGAHAARPDPVAVTPPVVESSFGPGSAVPLAGGASPGDAFTIKGNADSMKYHTAASPYFGRTIAEVWFDSEDAARGAGFHRWDEKKAEVAALVAIPDGAYGPGSADPLEGGASPGEAFTIKGNADSMKYHTTASPYFGRTIAEVWFDSEDAARGAGFRRWDEKKAEVAALVAIPDGAYGPGSADPTEDGSAPGDGFTIKGNADSMLFHGPESPYYGRTKAEVWFTDADTARRAGFTGWDEN